MLYLAYGSDLNIGQMQYECPGSKPLGKAFLEDWKLEFKSHKWSGAYLNVRKEKGCRVPVALWYVPDDEVDTLDKYEGYPVLYDRVEVPVPYTIQGIGSVASIYIMKNANDNQYPTSHYIDICIQGYKDFGFDLDYLKEALTECCQKLIKKVK